MEPRELSGDGPQARATSCLDENQIVQMLDGRLHAAARVEAEAHLGSCDACRRLVAAFVATDAPSVAGDTEALDLVAEPPGQGSFRAEREVLGRGESIGRYLVLSLIGCGGMGEVYAAYDPQLDRRVALKLLRSAEGDRQRLIREARALGKLSHPNVVQVYDAGEHGRDVFVAMELVDGDTLDAWCRAQPPPGWRAVLAAYLEAARGLSAAHAQGLVHRDVKPSNILRGKDGRVRVVDFGLVAPFADGGGGDAPTEQEIQPLHERLTLTGALIGTPAYMAPEQHEQSGVGPASDQYSLCVALHEALYRILPFGAAKKDVVLGEALSALLEQKKRGVPVSAPAGSPVPTWIYRAVAKGLAPKPEDRYPSLDALIAAVGPDREAHRRGWRRTAAIGISVCMLAGALGLARRGAVADPCAHPEQRLAGTWDETVKGRVRAAFLGTGRSYAEGTATRVFALLDGYAGSWAAMEGEVCAASRHETQQPNLLVLREACLDRRRGRFQALTTLFADKPDTDVLDKAVEAAAGLGPVAYCADTEALTARVRPPEDPALRTQVAALQPRVDRLEALHAAGKYKEGMLLGENLLDETAGLPYLPLRAQVAYWTGRLVASTGDYERAKGLLGDAGLFAAEGRDDVLAALAATWLFKTLGHNQERHDEALALRAIVQMTVARAADDPTTALWSVAEGNVLMDANRIAAAAASFDRAVAIYERLLAPNPVEAAVALTSRAHLYRGQRDFSRAKADDARAVASLENALGPDHPAVAAAEYDMAIVLDEMGDLPGALALGERALASEERALGPVHPKLAWTLTNLGSVLEEMGELPRARSVLERALSIKENASGRNERSIAVTVTILGAVAYELGELPRAKALFERALATYEKAIGPDHPDVAWALAWLGRTLTRVGQSDAALPLLDRALALRERTQGSTHQDLADPLLGLGELYLARRAPERALPLLERGLALASDEYQTDLRLTLAEALWQTGKDRARARELAEQARVDCERIGRKLGLEHATRWLGAHPAGR
jgi:serine/threonine-protein kinase